MCMDVFVGTYIAFGPVSILYQFLFFSRRFGVHSYDFLSYIQLFTLRLFPLRIFSFSFLFSSFLQFPYFLNI